MVSQCANPKCGRPFHSMKQGRLLVLAPVRKSAAQEIQPDLAWLCENCVHSFNVVRGEDGRVHLQHLPTKAAA